MSKCNVDVVVFAEQILFGVGMFLCNEHGQFVKAKTSHSSRYIYFTSIRSRILGSISSKTLDNEFGFHNVTFEVDCKTIVRYENRVGIHETHPEFVLILMEKPKLIKVGVAVGFFPTVKVGFEFEFEMRLLTKISSHTHTHIYI